MMSLSLTWDPTKYQIPFIFCSIPMLPGAHSITVSRLSLRTLSVDELSSVQTLCILSPIFNCPPINICASIYVVVCPPLRGSAARCLYQRRDRVIVNNKPHVSESPGRSLFINYSDNGGDGEAVWCLSSTCGQGGPGQQKPRGAQTGAGHWRVTLGVGEDRLIFW